MGPLIDTDAFWKLAVGSLLEEALSLLGSDLRSSERLPALPHMLRRSRLQRKLGDRVSEGLVPLAERMGVLGVPSAAWLDPLTPIQAIDPGEAQIFALAAQEQRVLITGDRRALAALATLPIYADQLAGRIVVLEAILLGLCARFGADEVRRRVEPLAKHDKVVQVCFSSGNSDPVEALGSYFRNAEVELKPLTLWTPGSGSTP